VSNDRTVSARPVLSFRGLRKAYGSTVALKGVDMAIKDGTVHALVGQNGAGKSTLVKILAGTERPDAGSITVGDGPAVNAIGSPSDAELLGIGVVHQDHPLVSGMTVAENMLLGMEPRTRFGRLDRKDMRHLAGAALREIGTVIEPTAYVEDLHVGEREQVAIAAALLRSPKLLLLDEPTASLGRDEVRTLFGVIERLRERGTALLFVSHFLDDVTAVSDEVTILRNGEVVLNCATADTTIEAISREMIGRDRGPDLPFASTHGHTERSRERTSREVVVALSHVSAGVARDVTLELSDGECVAVVGVSGSGAEDIGLAVAGLERRRGGDISFRGARIRQWQRSRARQAGVGFVPSDRRVDGLFPEESLAQNIVSGRYSTVSRFGVLRRGATSEVVNAALVRLPVQCRSPRQLVRQLSGGNQQKVLLCRWLDARFPVLVLIGPTTGVDVGARHDIYEAIEQYKAAGGTVLLVSSDLAEVLRLSDRILVMVRGTALEARSTTSFTQASLLERMLGGTPSSTTGPGEAIA